MPEQFPSSGPIIINNVAYTIPELWYNGTAFDTDYCTPDTCSLVLGTFLYLPNVPANAFFAALFAIFLLVNIPLGIRYRTWGVSVGLIIGLLLELIGYIGRILIHNNDFAQNPFLIYIICLTIGPAFLSAAIYLCLARIVVVFGESNSRFKPRTYSIAFMLSDFISLVLQGAGGGIASTANTKSTENVGVNMMIAGLVFQVVSITLFAVVCADFAFRVRSGKGSPNPAFTGLRRSTKWTMFLIALAIATLAIYIRSIYRVAELQAGFHSALANNQTLYMILEPTMITIAAICLTVFHPGLVFKDQWSEANFAMKGAKQEYKVEQTNGSGSANYE